MLTKEDINEAMVIAVHAQNSGLNEVQIDSERAVTLCEMASKSIDRGVKLVEFRAFFEGIIDNAPIDAPVESLDIYRGFIDQIDEVLS